MSRIFGCLLNRVLRIRTNQGLLLQNFEPPSKNLALGKREIRDIHLSGRLNGRGVRRPDAVRMLFAGLNFRL